MRNEKGRTKDEKIISADASVMPKEKLARHGWNTRLNFRIRFLTRLLFQRSLCRTSRALVDGTSVKAHACGAKTTLHPANRIFVVMFESSPGPTSQPPTHFSARRRNAPNPPETISNMPNAEVKRRPIDMLRIYSIA